MSIDIEKKNLPIDESDIIAHNLRYLMSTNNIDSNNLSKITGIAVSTINGIRRGAANPTWFTISSLTKHFGISVSQLTESAIDKTSKNRKIAYEIPLLHINELLMFLQNKSQYKKTILTELAIAQPEKFFAVAINNTSMAPLFDKGTVFIVLQDNNVYDGDIVLVSFGDNIPCFRKIFIEAQNYFFKPLTENIQTTIENYKNYMIHGVVIKAIQFFSER